MDIYLCLEKVYFYNETLTKVLLLQIPHVLYIIRIIQHVNWNFSSAFYIGKYTVLHIFLSFCKGTTFAKVVLLYLNGGKHIEAQKQSFTKTAAFHPYFSLVLSLLSNSRYWPRKRRSCKFLQKQVYPNDKMMGGYRTIMRI